jgi:hypothetical protein
MVKKLQREGSFADQRNDFIASATQGRQANARVNILTGKPS